MQYDGDANYAADPYGYPAARSGRRGMLALGGALVGVAAFAGVIVFAYGRGERAALNGTPPLLEADSTPTKLRPDDPGGYEVPHQDKLVYERLNAAGTKPAVERLLPPPEQPLPRPVVSPQVAPLQPAPEVAVAQIPAPAPPPAQPQRTMPDGDVIPPAVPVPSVQSAALSPAPPPTGHSTQVAALPAAPQQPKPTAAKPAASPTQPPPATAKPAPTAATAKPAPASASPPVAAPAKPVSSPPAAAKPSAQAASLTAPPALAQPPATAAAKPSSTLAPASGVLAAPSAAKPGGAAAPSAGRGGWRVQLASVPSEALAQGEWKRLSGRHAEVLGGLGVSFAQANINGSTYYRVQAGMVDETRARSICAALKAQSVGCILVAP